MPYDWDDEEQQEEPWDSWRTVIDEPEDEQQQQYDPSDNSSNYSTVMDDPVDDEDERVAEAAALKEEERLRREEEQARIAELQRRKDEQDRLAALEAQRKAAETTEYEYEEEEEYEDEEQEEEEGDGDDSTQYSDNRQEGTTDREYDEEQEKQEKDDEEEKTEYKKKEEEEEYQPVDPVEEDLKPDDEKKKPDIGITKPPDDPFKPPPDPTQPVDAPKPDPPTDRDKKKEEDKKDIDDKDMDKDLNEVVEWDPNKSRINRLLDVLERNKKMSTLEALRTDNWGALKGGDQPQYGQHAMDIANMSGAALGDLQFEFSTGGGTEEQKLADRIGELGPLSASDIAYLSPEEQGLLSSLMVDQMQRAADRENDPNWSGKIKSALGSVAEVLSGGVYQKGVDMDKMRRDLEARTGHSRIPLGMARSIHEGGAGVAQDALQASRRRVLGTRRDDEESFGQQLRNMMTSRFTT